MPRQNRLKIQKEPVKIAAKTEKAKTNRLKAEYFCRYFINRNAMFTNVIFVLKNGDHKIGLRFLSYELFLFR